MCPFYCLQNDDNVRLVDLEDLEFIPVPTHSRILSVSADGIPMERLPEPVELAAPAPGSPLPQVGLLHVTLLHSIQIITKW